MNGLTRGVEAEVNGLTLGAEALDVEGLEERIAPWGFIGFGAVVVGGVGLGGGCCCSS